VGRILGRFRGLWRGPRLTGTLHREGSDDEAVLVLTAEITGGGTSGTWRVSTEDLVDQAERDGDPHEVAYALVRQLAYRIVAALTAVGSPRWEAVQAFTEGLRAYRKVQRTRSGRHAELRRAEAFFLRALQADQRFVACYYNLGTVYSQLGEAKAAAPVFREAISADPDNVAAYLGLAELYYEIRDYLRSQIYARKAIDLDRDQVRAWILWGVAWVLDEIARHGSARSIPDEEWTRILGIFRAAPAVAWKNLCRQELSGRVASRTEARRWVSICLNNLAEAYFVRGNPELGEHPVREALEVAPREPFLHLALGKCLVNSIDSPRSAEGLKEAEAALYRASDESLRLSERGARWAWLLWVHDKRGEKDKACRAFRAFLDAIVPGEKSILATSPKTSEEARKAYCNALDGLRKNLGKLPDLPEEDPRHSRENLEKLVRFLASVEGGPRLGEESPRALWRDLRAEDRGWALSQWRIAWARSVIQKALPERPALAVRWLERVLAELREEHGRQIRRQGLESLLARARLRETERSRSAVADGSHPPASPSLQGTLCEALTAATRSVLHAPESALRRMVLSQVYGALKDYQLAERERVTALGLGSAAELCCDPRTLAGLETEWRETYDATAEGERPEVLRRAREHLERLLRSVEGGPADGSEATEAQRFQEHAAVHLGLGRICFAAKDWPEAIRHLRIARESGHGFEEASLLLGQALTSNRAPSTAAAALRDLLDRPQVAAVPPDGRLRLAEAELRLAWLEARWLDDPDEARRLVESAEGRLREADGTAPAHLRALGSLCRGELEAHRGRLFESLKHFKRSVAQSPSPEAYERLVEILLELAREHGVAGLIEQARATVRAAWVWNGSHATWNALSDLEKRLPAAPTA
jgi:tetratricopeptide (TPR) repeat protein